LPAEDTVQRYFVDADDCKAKAIFPGVQIRTAAGSQMMLSVVYFEPNSVVESHSHPHEQVGILLEGELTFTIGDQTQVVSPGQMWCIPGGVPHRVVAGPKRAKALDVFHPVREDYL
jgi:quercetin dioxygenase-like cupin family protein